MRKLKEPKRKSPKIQCANEMRFVDAM